MTDLMSFLNALPEVKEQNADDSGICIVREPYERLSLTPKRTESPTCACSCGSTEFRKTDWNQGSSLGPENWVMTCQGCGRAYVCYLPDYPRGIKGKYLEDHEGITKVGNEK